MKERWLEVGVVNAFFKRRARLSLPTSRMYVAAA